MPPVSEPSLATPQTPSGARPGARPGVILLDGLRAACMLLTRFPVGARPLADEARRWAAAFLPVVGLGLGLLGALALLGLGPPLGARLAAALTVGLMLLATGALHEDGLADTADALGGAYSRERLFAILKDSRLGTYGVLALVLTLFIRIEALAALGPRGPAAFVLAAVLSRAPLPWMMAALPYVTPDSVARSANLMRVGVPVVAAATGATLLVLAGAVGLGALPWAVAAGAAAGTAIVALVGAWRFHRRAGGITGDFLGATQQASELVVLLILLAAA